LLFDPRNSRHYFEQDALDEGQMNLSVPGGRLFQTMIMVSTKEDSIRS
jgi:hypothetical protein